MPTPSRGPVVATFASWIFTAVRHDNLSGNGATDGMLDAFGFLTGPRIRRPGFFSRSRRLMYPPTRKNTISDTPMAIMIQSRSVRVLRGSGALLFPRGAAKVTSLRRKIGGVYKNRQSMSPSDGMSSPPLRKGYRRVTPRA